MIDKDFLQNIQLYLFDMDGTVYMGPNRIEGAFETVEYLRKHGKKICFLTNNSSIPRLRYIDKLRDGYDFLINADEIYSSSTATIEYLNKHYPNKKVYVVASEAVRQEFTDGGIIFDDVAPDIVVLTFDKELTYHKLELACRFITQGAVYIATHPDMVCPFLPTDLPDIGSFILLIEGATGRRPDVICGKPYEAMGESIINKFHLSPAEIAMVGDRLHTDIRFGVNNDFTSILVLTGETTREMLATSPDHPTIVLDTLSDYVKLLENE